MIANGMDFKGLAEQESPFCRAGASLPSCQGQLRKVEFCVLATLGAAVFRGVALNVCRGTWDRNTGQPC